MKRVTIIILFLCLRILSFAQQTNFEGLVLDKNSNDSVPFVSVQLFNHSDTLLTQTNFSGKFHFTNFSKGVYNIRLNFLGYKQFDTLIKLDNYSNLTFRLSVDTTKGTLYKSDNNKEGAITDIKNGTIKLFLPGGFVGSPVFPLDTAFEKKYKIEFISLGCVRMEGDNFKEYNQTVFKYLDKKYGKSWRKEVRQDLIGLKE